MTSSHLRITVGIYDAERKRNEIEIKSFFTDLVGVFLSRVPEQGTGGLVVLDEVEHLLRNVGQELTSLNSVVSSKGGSLEDIVKLLESKVGAIAADVHQIQSGADEARRKFDNALKKTDVAVEKLHKSADTLQVTTKALSTESGSLDDMKEVINSYEGSNLRNVAVTKDAMISMKEAVDRLGIIEVSIKEYLSHVRAENILNWARLSSDAIKQLESATDRYIEYAGDQTEKLAIEVIGLKDAINEFVNSADVVRIIEALTLLSESIVQSAEGNKANGEVLWNTNSLLTQNVEKLNSINVALERISFASRR